MTHEIQKCTEQKINHGARNMGAVLVSRFVERAKAAAKNREPVVGGVISYFEDEGPSIINFRGCGESYPAQAPMIYSKMSGFGSMHFESQTQGVHSQELIDQSVIKACKSDGDRDRVFVCTSMGLMNAMRSLMNPAVQQAIGEGHLRAIISRSGITSKYDLQPSMQRAAEVSSYVPKLPIVAALWRAHRLHVAHGPIAHSEGTTDAQARLHYESSAHMRFSLVGSQYNAIDESEQFGDGSHRQIADNNPELELFQLTAEHDSVANWKNTNTSLERAFCLPVETITDERQPDGSHAADLEFIEPLQEVMSKITKRERDVGASARRLVMYSGGGNFALAS